MSEIKQLFQLPTLPGIKRDGTLTDGDNWTDGQWIRFQRGKLKKMGGMVAMTALFSGPPRAMYLWPQLGFSNLTSFSGYGVEQTVIDSNGLGGFITDRLTAFTYSADVLWTVDSIYDAAAGSSKSLLLAVPTYTATNIDDRTETKVYWADPTDITQFSQVGLDATYGVASGGLYCSSPYTTLYGNDGKVTWSNANEPKNYTTGDAGTARVTGMKIVKGLPMRTGSGPGGLLWSLDSLTRQDYIGGSQIFRFSPVGTKSTILAQNSVIEYDGNYYWLGIDRFLVTNGSQIAELPNQMSTNWFFDNLNYSARQKIWAMKVPRYGEIWWFFPYGTAPECNKAVIYNVREQTWYDAICARSAGYSSQVFCFPVLANNQAEISYQLTISVAFVIAPAIGDQIFGDVTGARGIVSFYTAGTTSLYIQLIGSTQFATVETISNLTTPTNSPVVSAIRTLYDCYMHENGHDLVENGTSVSIQAYAESNDFGLPTGGAQLNQPSGINRWTRLVRVEPDFVMSGDMKMTVIGREFAQADDVTSIDYPFGPNTGKIDTREQYRSIRVRFESNTLGGNFEAGRIVLHTEPGDVRS
jgi:hypothetical protein